MRARDRAKSGAAPIACGRSTTADGPGRGFGGGSCGYPVERIFSSPSVRCIETFLPLAMQRGLDVEERLELGEGASRESALALVDAAEGPGLVLCTHGDVVEELQASG